MTSTRVIWFDGLFNMLDLALLLLSIIIARRCGDGVQRGWPRRAIVLLRGSILLIVCLGALSDAVVRLLHGYAGSTVPPFGPLRFYALLITSLSAFVCFYLTVGNRDITSHLVDIDRQSWRMTATLNGVMLGGFVVGHALLTLGERVGGREWRCAAQWCVVRLDALLLLLAVAILLPLQICAIRRACANDAQHAMRDGR